jgi:hypothetical protein
LRVVYLTDRALAITRRLMLRHRSGKLFRNSDGRPWTTEAVNCAFRAVRQRIGKEEMRELRTQLVASEVRKFMRTQTAVSLGFIVEQLNNVSGLRAELILRSVRHA